MIQNHSIDGLLEQAQEAAQEGDWALLTQHLQQIQATVSLQSLYQDAPDPATSEDPFQQLLNLALMVLEQGDFYDRWEIAKVLPAFDVPAVPYLIEFLQDADAEWELRWFSARMLGEFKHPSVTEALLKVLQTDVAKDADLNAIVAEALVSLGSDAVAALTGLLAQPETRLPAVKALAQMRHPETLSSLLSVASDPQPTVRVIAIEALAGFHDPGIIPVLQTALQDPIAAVRQEAVTVLGLHTDFISAPDLLEQLGHCLTDPHLAVQQQAVTALARLGTPAAADFLFQALLAPSTLEVLQIELVRAFGWMNTALALSYLQRFLLEAEPTGPILREVVIVLGRFKQPELRTTAVEMLLSLSNKIQDTEIKQALTVSFSELGHPQAVDCLIQLMGDSEVTVRLHAIAALKKLDSAGTNFRRLQELAHDPSLSPELRQSAAMALQEW